MGQGLYDVIVFGITEHDINDIEIPAEFIANEDSPIIHDLLQDFFLIISEEFLDDDHFVVHWESHAYYMGIAIAYSDGALAERYNAKMFPHQFAIPFFDLEQFLLDSVEEEEIEKARAKWQEVRKTVKNKWDITLPDGQLLYANDWD